MHDNLPIGLRAALTATGPLPVPETEKGQEIVATCSQPPVEIPLVVNEQVREEIETLKKAPYSVNRWLATAERFSPLMKGILRSRGVPEALVYVAILESGFDPTAVSVMGAGGPWQFIPTTAKGFGMKMNDWVDERRDFEKSTTAAAKYFSGLFASFSNWELALAGYNCGSGSVNSAIESCGSLSLWEMGKMGKLTFQAQGYVPRVLAIMAIMQDPKRYGFAPPAGVVPFTYDKVWVPGGLPLWFFAQVLGVQEKTLGALNPELLRGVTPPDEANYELKIPSGKKPLFLKKFPEAYEHFGEDLIERGRGAKGRAK